MFPIFVKVITFIQNDYAWSFIGTSDTDLNQPEPSQIENAKQKVRLNSNQRVIQPLANICWNPVSTHATILICG